MLTLPIEPTEVAIKLGEKLVRVCRTGAWDLRSSSIRLPEDISPFLGTLEYGLCSWFINAQNQWACYFANVAEYGYGAKPMCLYPKFEKYFALWLLAERSVYSPGLERILTAIQRINRQEDFIGFSDGISICDECVKVDSEFIVSAICMSEHAFVREDFLDEFQLDEAFSAKIWQAGHYWFAAAANTDFNSYMIIVANDDEYLHVGSVKGHPEMSSEEFIYRNSDGSGSMDLQSIEKWTPRDLIENWHYETLANASNRRH